MTTFAPASASRRVIALPMPRPPPVTRATLPLKEIEALMRTVSYPASGPVQRGAGARALCDNGRWASPEARMSGTTADRRDGPSFAETALRLGGKSEDEVRRLG